MSERTQVLEYSKPKIVDGVIKGVKIIGMQSDNGHTYPRAVLRDAKPLYESAPVYIFHPDDREQKQGSRRHVDHFGNLQNIHERNSRKTPFGLFGDLQTKPSHPMTAGVIRAIEEGSARFGLSHNALCELSEDRKRVIEIVEVNSVDLVDKPGTNENLFEEEESEMATLTKIAGAGAEGEGEGRTLKEVLEQITTDLDGLAATAKETRAEIDKIRDRGLPEKGKKKGRLSVLEDRSAEGEGIEPGDPAPIGNTHDDWLGALRGYSVTN